MRFWPIVLFVLTPLFFLFAQKNVVRYPAGHAMSYGTVNDLAFTSDGYLWLGGQTSLRRYDGNEMEYFGHRREHPHSLSNDFVHSLYESPDGTLWIGHQRGFSRFDPTLEHYINYRPPVPSGSRLTVYQFYAVASNQLWLSTNSGLIAFDPTTEKFHPDSIFSTLQATLGLGRVNAFYPYDENRLLLGTTTGLFQFDPAEKSLKCFPNIKHQVKGIARTDNGDLIVAADTSVVRYRVAEDSLFLVRALALVHPPADLFSINDFVGVGDDLFYVGTTNGLYEVNWSTTSTPQIVNYTHNPDDENSLASNSVFSLLRSSDDVLLIGSRRGVDRISLRTSPITVIRRIPGEVDLCHDVTTGSAVDEAHNLLLVGTYNGLSIVDLATNSVRCYTPENLPGMHKARLFNIDPGPRPHTFWLGYRQGGTNLLVLDNPEEPRIEEVYFTPHDLSAAGVFQVVSDNRSVSWLATSNGLFSYDPVSELTTAFPAEATDSTTISSNNLFTVLNDSKGRLWVGTRNGGLCLKQSLDGVEGFTCFRYDDEDPSSLPSDMVLHLFEDANGRIWVSNPEALSVYQEDGTFRSFGLDDGLPYALCYGAFADAKGRMWVAFGGNFCRIELSDSGEFHLHEIVTMRDGLAGQANSQYGWSLLPDGRFALSQRAGLNLFHPDSSFADKGFPPIILTDLELFDHSVSPNQRRDTVLEPGYLLPDDINRLESIQLPPGQDFISIKFSAPEYRPGYETFFGYRIVGIQDNWTDLEQRTFLSFPKLPPGDYILELRTGDQLERWSQDIRKLNIHLAAPWHQRWWAYAFYILFSIVAVFLGTRFAERQRQRVATARVEEREELRRRSAQDFHDEAGNHLSRVSLLTSLVERQLAEEQNKAARTQVQGMLQEIGANTQVLREGMRDFIWALDPDNDNAGELALRLKRFGQELFAHHPGEFRAGPFLPDLNAIPLLADERRHLMLMFKEAMHNSLKHAPTATKLSLGITRDGERLALDWKDNGPGYPYAKETNGMGMKSMRSRATKIGADITVSGVDGCTVFVSLSISPK